MKFLSKSEAVNDWMTISPEFRTEAELVKRLASVKESHQDYSAWLVEIMWGNNPVYFQLAHDDDWTHDHDKALHFCRKVDAEMCIEHYGWTMAKPVEHMWPNVPIRP